MKRQLKNPMYEIDQSGKLKLLPLQWDSPPGQRPGSSIKKMSEEKRKVLAELKPLCLSDFAEPRSKVRKTDSVRKGLFTKPQVKENQPSRISLARRNSVARKNSTTFKKVKEPAIKNNLPLSSPLLNLEEVEEELLTKKPTLPGYPFKSPNRPSFNFSRSVSKSKPLNIPHIIVEEPNQTASQSDKNGDHVEMDQNIKEKEPKTPDSQSSTEFLKLEKMCIDSPVSSMCNLLEDTGLNSIKRPKPGSSKPGDMKSLLRSLEDIIESEQTAFKKYQEAHEHNMRNLQTLLASYKEKDTSNSDKENSPIPLNQRRSIRLQNRSPLRPNNDKLLVSPGILKSGDLRKSTLKKNLAARNKDYTIQGCRTPKPTELFRKLKQSILETPKTERKCLIVEESPGMRYISMMVQNQCLMLQDTPVHK